jgi:hypothetical protein
MEGDVSSKDKMGKGVDGTYKKGSFVFRMRVMSIGNTFNNDIV